MTVPSILGTLIQSDLEVNKNKLFRTKKGKKNSLFQIIDKKSRCTCDVNALSLKQNIK